MITVKFVFFAMVFVLACRPLFRGQAYVLAAIISLAYLKGEVFDPWHAYNGRAFAILGVIAVQFCYVFLSGTFEKVQWDQAFRTRIYAFSIFVLSLLFFQDMKVKVFHSYLVNLMDKQKGVVTYEEASERLPRPARSVLSGYFTRQKTISLHLMRGTQDIDRYIDKKVDAKFPDMFDLHVAQSMTNKLQRKNLTMSAPLIQRP